MCLITFDKFLTNVKLFHVYIKVHNTTSDIGHKPAISNIFNRFEYISSVVWNKYLVVQLTMSLTERVVSLLRHAMGCLPGNNRVVTR